MKSPRARECSAGAVPYSITSSKMVEKIILMFLCAQARALHLTTTALSSHAYRSQISRSFGSKSRFVAKQMKMAKPVLLSDDERTGKLAKLYKNDWFPVTDRDAIKKSFVFKDFYSAFAFMTQTAMYCEKIDHHPEWSNVYNKVEVTLTTHDCNGLSVKDVDMAEKMDSFLPEGKD